MDDSEMEDFEAPRKRQMNLCDTSEKLCSLDIVRRKLDFDAKPLFNLPITFMPSLVDAPIGHSRNPFMNLLDSNAPLPKFRQTIKDQKQCPAAKLQTTLD